MALIKSTILSSIRGSINGATFSQNRTGAYMRNRTVPVNPNSSAQVLVRTAMQMVTNWWSNELTEVEREAWNLYAASTPVTNRLGDTVHQSGFAFFTAIGTFRYGILDPVNVDSVGDLLLDIRNAPTNPGLLPPVAVNTLTLTGGEAQEIALTMAAPATTQPLQLYMSLPLTAGTRFYKGPWTRVAVGGVGTYPSKTYVLAPGTMTVGQIYKLRLRGYTVPESANQNKLTAELITDPITVIADTP
jgi:hypothetical protein